MNSIAFYSILLILGVLSFFIAYSLSKNDLVLLRRDISLNKIFDLVILFGIGGLFISRVVYVLLERQLVYWMQPLIFLHILRFPGISFIGFFLGGIIILKLFLRDKIAFYRICDILILSFFPFFSLFIVLSPILPGIYIEYVLFGISLIIFFLMLRFHKEYFVRDGSVSIIFLVIISFYLVIKSFFPFIEIKSRLSLYQIFLFIIFFSSSLLLLFNEHIIRLKSKR